MARWIELTVGLALLAGAAGQARPPAELFVAEQEQRAVLLEFAEFYADPTSDASVVSRLAAGTVLEYVGETTDAFGRTWYTLRDPDRLVRRRDTYLVPFDRRQFAAFGNRGAMLANRIPQFVAAPAQQTEEEEPWWQPVGVLELGHHATFDAVVGITASAPNEDDVRELIALLGGAEAIAIWPSDPLPGELFVPTMVPVLFQFDGTEWQLALPVRLLGKALNLLGNGMLRADTDAPPLAGGPALYCWDLVGAINPSNQLAGSVAVPGAPVAPRGGAAPLPDMAPYDLSLAPKEFLEVLPPAPPETRIPRRVDPPPAATGVILEDDAARQAVFIEQLLDLDLTHRLRGKSLVLDVVARNAPRSQSAATFGVDIEVGFADDRPEQLFSTSFTSAETPRRFEWPFDLPEDAETLTVRLLPIDRTLAVEQRGSIVFERAALRLASWEPEAPASSIVLNRVTANTFEGALLHTRTPIAVTQRAVADVQRAWTQVVVSDWTDADKAFVLAGEVRKGMTPDQVRAAWGEPAQASTADARSASEARWDYEDRYAVFVEGKVVLYRPRLVDEVESTMPICPGDISVPTGAPAPGGALVPGGSPALGGTPVPDQERRP